MAPGQAGDSGAKVSNFGLIANGKKREIVVLQIDVPKPSLWAAISLDVQVFFVNVKQVLQIYPTMLFGHGG